MSNVTFSVGNFTSDDQLGSRFMLSDPSGSAILNASGWDWRTIPLNYYIAMGFAPAYDGNIGSGVVLTTDQSGANNDVINCTEPSGGFTASGTYTCDIHLDNHGSYSGQFTFVLPPPPGPGPPVCTG